MSEEDKAIYELMSDLARHLNEARVSTTVAVPAVAKLLGQIIAGSAQEGQVGNLLDAVLPVVRREAELASMYLDMEARGLTALVPRFPG